MYGSDPTERARLVTFIQKMIRGYLVRGIRFRDTRNIDRFTSLPTQGNVFAMLSRPTPSHRVGIRLVNTGTEDINIRWIRPDSSLGRETTIRSGNTDTTNISTFVTHSFYVGNITEPKIVRIPRFFKSGTVFDVKTGFSFTIEHWNDIAERVISKKIEDQIVSSERTVPSETPPQRGCQCPRCVARRREREIEEREEEERIQIAIMLSIQESEIRDGSFDYSEVLVDMFRDE